MAKDPYAIGYSPTPDATLEKQVTSDISAAIASEIAPLQSLAGQRTTDRDRAIGEIGSLFGGLQPFVEGSAERVGQSYDQALAGEKAIFQQASARLDALRAQQGADAQALAQQIGSPVPLDNMFTAGITKEQGLGTLEAAGSLLHGAGLQQAGVQEAEAFAGKVFPLMRVEETSRTRSQFDAEIKQIQDQIAAIKSSKGARISEELTKRKLAEREFALQRAQANRDFFLAKKSVAMEKERLALSRTELFGEDKKGKPTLAGKQVKAAQKQQKAEIANNRKETALGLIEAYTTPGSQTVTVSQMVPVAGPDSPGAFWNGSQWVKYENVKQQVPKGQTYTDPGEIYEKVMNRLGIDPRGNPGFDKWLQQMVGNATGNNGWVYGQAAEKGRRTGEPPPRREFPQIPPAKLKQMSPAQLINHLRKDLGFRQAVPAGIKKYQKGARPSGQSNVTNPTPNNKEYNSRLKNWAIYWIQRIYAADTGAKFADYPH